MNTITIPLPCYTGGTYIDEIDGYTHASGYQDLQIKTNFEIDECLSTPYTANNNCIDY